MSGDCKYLDLTADGEAICVCSKCPKHGELVNEDLCTANGRSRVGVVQGDELCPYFEKEE